jgi:hypothetical protein
MGASRPQAASVREAIDGENGVAPSKNQQPALFHLKESIPVEKRQGARRALPAFKAQRSVEHAGCDRPETFVDRNGATDT